MREKYGMLDIPYMMYAMPTNTLQILRYFHVLCQ